MTKIKTYLKELELWLRLLAKQAVRPFVPGGEVCMEARLYATKISPDGTEKDYGLVSTKLVTDAFVDFIVDQLQAETSEFGDLRFHDSGTGTTAENAAQTGLITKVEIGRATGTQTEGASTNIYRSVGTISYTGTHAVTEHGIFTQASGGTMADRSVFSAINVTNGDSIQFTYELTFPSGG